jgi:thioredoxin 1
MKIIKIGGKTCAECKTMVPRWKEIESEMPELETEMYVIEEHPELTEKYSLKAIPTFIFMDKDGNELSRLTKIQTKERLIEEINKYRDK